MIKLKDNAYKGYTLCRMQECDFVFVKDFLDRSRERLERIEFFYPYKDAELKSALASGYFLGLLDGDRLIATFALDSDEEYAETLANLLNGFDGGDLQRAYESSGLMVDEKYRGMGIAKYLMGLIVRYAKERGIALCGVVHTQNAASMSTFFSYGFKLKAVWHMSEGYDFVYLLLTPQDKENKKEKLKNILQSAKNGVRIKGVEAVANGDSARHFELLKEGYVGVDCTDTHILFLK